MRKNRLHTSSLIIGSVIALAISFSQFLGQGLSVSAKEVKTVETENDVPNETQSYISLPSFSLPAPIHVQVNLNPYCLFELFFEEDVDENQTAEDWLHPDRYFETLFRVIISPNAP